MAEVTVKLFGLFRLDSGIHEIRLSGQRVRDLYEPLAEAARAKNPATAFSEKQLRGCMVLINGRPAREKDRLQQGDQVFLLSPVAGG